LCCKSNSAQVYIASTNSMLPLRWMAIECIIEDIFSEKSDV
jgi:hypothetical protein